MLPFYRARPAPLTWPAGGSSRKRPRPTANITGESPLGEAASQPRDIAVVAVQLDRELIDPAEPGQVLGGGQDRELAALDVHLHQADAVDAVLR
jgi:hypothetical protein